MPEREAGWEDVTRLSLEEHVDASDVMHADGKDHDMAREMLRDITSSAQFHHEAFLSDDLLTPQEQSHSSFAARFEPRVAHLFGCSYSSHHIFDRDLSVAFMVGTDAGDLTGEF